MASESAGWLATVFIHAARDAGANAAEDVITAEANSVLAAWGDPNRVCHNTKFLIRVLDEIDNLAGCAHAPDELQLAAFYHGAVFYTPRSLDYLHVGRDLFSGAHLASDQLPKLGISLEVVTRICGLITAVAQDDFADGDVDKQVFHDALLASLTLPPQDYRDYRERMSAQYAHLPRRVFVLGRRHQIMALLDRPTIFLSPLADEFEELARSNLTAELARLNQELGDTTATDTEAARITSAGPTTGTIIIKKVKAKLKAAADREDLTEPARPVTPVAAVDEVVTDEPARDVSSLEAIEDDLADFASSHTAEQPRVDPQTD